MTSTLIHKDSYEQLTSRQVKEVIEYLHQNTTQFNITVKLKHIEFNPKLPQSIYERLNEYTMFTLANFTFSSLKIFDNHIEFETGFGSSNFGSVCSMPYHSIFQLGLEDSILFINPVATIDKVFQKDLQKQRSMNAFKLKGKL
jgi:hypothetical protein